MKLNIGSGYNNKDGFENLDRVGLPNIKYVHDLNILPWPFKDNTIEEIAAIDVIEHLPNTMDIMNEVWRILIPNGLIHIQVPDIEQSLYIACTDPTHVRYFTKYSFDYWDPETDHGKKYGFYTDKKFKIEKKEIKNNAVNVWMRKII